MVLLMVFSITLCVTSLTTSLFLIMTLHLYNLSGRTFSQTTWLEHANQLFLFVCFKYSTMIKQK